MLYSVGVNLYFSTLDCGWMCPRCHHLLLAPHSLHAAIGDDAPMASITRLIGKQPVLPKGYGISSLMAAALFFV